ncbi:hypothetical protein, partial [Hydrogenibacillus schlegelii]|uniref:hypothetical protein n=1 Tax=Hydrogenibacillus schlegelii TaxID=1484 RepID=UPI0034A04278
MPGASPKKASPSSAPGRFAWEVTKKTLLYAAAEMAGPAFFDLAQDRGRQLDAGRFAGHRITPLRSPETVEYPLAVPPERIPDLDTR